MNEIEVTARGNDSGEGMIVRYQTKKGTEIFGIAIPNVHTDTEWDLGPTWCYLVLGKKVLLIDTGRFGNMEILRDRLETIGRHFSDIDIIIPTHGHEDHDGNLPDVLPLTRAQLWAHELYRSMIAYHPEIRDGANRPDLPGSCRSCVMPETFVKKNCLPYHRKRSKLNIDACLNDEAHFPIDEIDIHHTPGHSPDSLCIALEDEVIFTGDTILPDITPHPSRAQYFETNRRILPQKYQGENRVYGLVNYIRSLNRVAGLDSGRFRATFPAHRLFYDGQFNLIDRTRDRARAIIQFHIDRCQAVLNIVKSRPKQLDEIAAKHFTSSQLTGFGILMARNELLAHIELMESCDDVRWIGDDRSLLQSTGTHRSLDMIGDYLN